MSNATHNHEDHDFKVAVIRLPWRVHYGLVLRTDNA